MPHIEFLADRREAGKTITAVLRVRYGLTWAQAQRLVAGGHVRVAGFACHDPALRIKAKNRVWIREGTLELKKPVPGKTPPAPVKPPPTPKKPVPKKPTPTVNTEPLPFDSDALVYIDDTVVVVNKPVGLTTMRHAEEAEEFGARGKTFLPKTLADYLPRAIGLPNAPILPVHRIDRDTSGLVVFARTPAAAAHLTKQFRKHTVERRYLALVRGTAKNGRVESVFVRDRGDGRRGSTKNGDAEDGKRAVTHVKVIEQFDGFAWVECRLETGRTHQVRIHLGEAGTPLCGERVYDRALNGTPGKDRSGAKRPMLHATRLGFVHPETGEAMTWTVAPPEDFATLLEQCRKPVEGTPWDV